MTLHSEYKRYSSCNPHLAAYVLGFLMVPACLSAQWSTGSGGSIYYNGGNVGIGTTSPAQSLHVTGNIEADGTFPLTIGTTGFAYFPANTSHVAYYRKHGQYEFYWRASDNGQPAGPNETTLMSLNDSRLFVAGSIGVGTASPRTTLDVNGQIVATNRLTLAQDTGTASQTWHIDNASGLFRLFWQPNIVTGGTVVLVATTAGNVGIGTANPQYPLSVNGTIQAKEVIVNTGWSDYVFDPGYKLMPLPQVATYIKQHHHLPGVPSQAEVKQKGVPVGEMESTLLAKVEELTVRMIDTDKRDSRLEEQNSKLIEQTRRLEQRIAQLELRNAQ